jgi:hypothetical protein
MKDETNWRPISPEEAAVIRSILSQADIRRSGALIADLDGAETDWGAVRISGAQPRFELSE